MGLLSKLMPQNNKTAVAFYFTGALWMIFATFAGLLAATELVAPNLSGDHGWLTFGRLRPLHVNLVLFGFVTPVLLGSAFYYLPRLLRTSLYSETLGIYTAMLWNLTLVCVVVSLLSGLSQGREYAEMIWPVDMMVVTVFGMVFANFIMTVTQRVERTLYVSVWYAVAGILLTAVTFSLGNVIWRPHTGALVGIPDALLLWFYGHNVFGLLLTPLAAGVAYYVIPKASGNPLYSHTLSLWGFWSLIIVYTHIGTHHLLQVPVPTWLKVIGIVDSIGMVIPVMVLLINLWYTAKGKLGELQANVGSKFVLTGTIMYFFVSIQGSMMALPQVQRVTHFNYWVVGHAHIGVLGFSGMIALGGLYYLLPKVTDKPLYSPFLAELQYWLILIGVVGFTVVLTIAGLIQGNSWLNGETVYRILPQIHMYNIMRASLGLMIFSGAVIGFYNVFRTIVANPREASS